MIRIMISPAKKMNIETALMAWTLRVMDNETAAIYIE
ncbi:hypothetical protein QF049_000473 [Paenibacillus sp. W4I10]|nr:hypothetical protein [Paenibacillus sp. W4I10]